MDPQLDRTVAAVNVVRAAFGVASVTFGPEIWLQEKVIGSPSGSYDPEASRVTLPAAMPV